MILHVIDASDTRYEEHIATTRGAARARAAAHPRWMVFSKSDAAPPRAWPRR
ncbi:MAG: hypothetical protein U0325_31905 [Polyangiales bacterium]